MTPIAIAAGGMVTNVGFNAPASCAAIRAGIRNIGEANLYDPATAEPVPCARVELPQWWETTGKLAELVAPRWLTALATMVAMLIVGLNVKLVFDYLTGVVG